MQSSAENVPAVECVPEGWPWKCLNAIVAKEPPLLILLRCRLGVQTNDYLPADIFVYIYIYIYIHICVYIYIYINKYMP